MALLWERWYPLMLGLAAAITYYFVPDLRDHKLPPSLAGLMSAIVSIAGIAVGFLAAAYSILISINDKPIIGRLKAAHYYKRILRYLRSAVLWSFSLAVLSAGWIVVNLDQTATWTKAHSAGMAIWLLCAVGSALTYYRVVHIFYAILDTLDGE